MSQYVKCDPSKATHFVYRFSMGVADKIVKLPVEPEDLNVLLETMRDLGYSEYYFAKEVVDPVTKRELTEGLEEALQLALIRDNDPYKFRKIETLENLQRLLRRAKEEA